MKQQALAGKALSMTGTAPLYMARTPSSRIGGRTRRGRRCTCPRELETEEKHWNGAHKNVLLSSFTCLQPALEHVRRDGHHPVEDPRHAAGEERPPDAQLGAVAALGGQRPLDDLVAAEVGGAGRNVCRGEKENSYESGT